MPPVSIPNDIYQYSLLSAYEGGLQKGGPPVAFLANHGTHGIGFFEANSPDVEASTGLADNMIMLDGVVSRVDSSGAAIRATKEEHMPFVMVTAFQPTRQHRVPKNTDRNRICAAVASSGRLAPAPVRITGRFSYINTAQETLWDVTGSIFGFVIPEWQTAVSGAGLRSCFLGRDGLRGGHVLDFTTADGALLEWSMCGRFHLGFPSDKDEADDDDDDEEDDDDDDDDDDDEDEDDDE